MHRKINKKTVGSLLVAVSLSLVVYIAWPSSNPTQKASSQKTPSSSSSVPPEFDKTKFSITDPASIWVVVNKTRPLIPKNYVPSGLIAPNLPLRVPGNESMSMRSETADALQKLFDAAKSDNVPLMVSSGYRSYNYQVGLYGGYVTRSGVAAADKFSARPGFSEHQTGLAVDVEPLNQECDVSTCFADLPAGKWLAANAYKFGFILRYTADKVPITGYDYEPWHIRYVGAELSNQMHLEGIETLEEFFGLASAPNYLN